MNIPSHPDDLKALVDKFDKAQVEKGLDVEKEHDDGGKLDVVKSALDLLKIVLAHLKEDPKYYDKLEKVEEGTSSGTYAYEDHKSAGQKYEAPKLPKNKFEDDVEEPNIDEPDREGAPDKRPRTESRMLEMFNNIIGEAVAVADYKEAQSFAKVLVKIEKNRNLLNVFSRLSQTPSDESTLANFKQLAKKGLSGAEYKLLINKMGLSENKMAKNQSDPYSETAVEMSDLAEATPKGFAVGQKVKSKHMRNTDLWVQEVPKGKDYVWVVDKKGHDNKIKIADLTLVKESSVLDANNLVVEALGKKDKQVIDSFTSKKAMEGQKLRTDGKRLDGIWMGGTGIAEWGKDGKIHFNDLGSKAAQSIQSAVRKNAPSNHIAEGKADKRATKEKDGEWAKHLRKDGKKAANKKIRKQDLEERSSEEMSAQMTKNRQDQAEKDRKKLNSMKRSEIKKQIANLQADPGGRNSETTKNQVKALKDRLAKMSGDYMMEDTVDEDTTHNMIDAPKEYDDEDMDNLARTAEQESQHEGTNWLSGRSGEESIKGIEAILKDMDPKSAEYKKYKKALDKAKKTVYGEGDAEKREEKADDLLYDDCDSLDEARFKFKNGSAVKYSGKPWTVKNSTKDWVELEDKRGYTTIVDFDDITAFEKGSIITERDIARFDEEMERMRRIVEDE